MCIDNLWPLWKVVGEIVRDLSPSGEETLEINIQWRNLLQDALREGKFVQGKLLKVGRCLYVADPMDMCSPCASLGWFCFSKWCWCWWSQEGIFQTVGNGNVWQPLFTSCECFLCAYNKDIRLITCKLGPNYCVNLLFFHRTATIRC